MKKFFGLMVAALLGVAANAEILTDSVLQGKGGRIPLLLISQDAETAKAELDVAKEKIQTAPANVKLDYATAVAINLGKEKADATYAELASQFDATAAELGLSLEANKGEYTLRKIALARSYLAGTAANRERMREAFEANQNLEETPENGYCFLELGHLKRELDGIDAAVPYYTKATGNALVSAKSAILEAYLLRGKPEQAAPYFYDLLSKGNLGVKTGIAAYPRILEWELTREDFDANQLKARLVKAILVYKAKARQWKGEGEDPYLQFIGMLQDTEKDL